MTDLFSTPIESLPADARRVGEMIEPRTSEHPISIDHIIIALDWPRETEAQRERSERRVCRLVATLRRKHHLPIGSARGAKHGFYWVTTAADADAWARQYKGQILSELATLAAVIGRQRTLEWVGQLRIEEAA